MIVDDTTDPAMVPTGCPSFSLGIEWANRLHLRLKGNVFVKNGESSNRTKPGK